ncbi:sigma-54 dependent transcriptional regulator [Desulfobotulus mexicanus]|uniref:Sigma-54-dependent Fis family transcriptional regulator n=1 Tax=Desulfobotulus mexicanus TaxID=2586642 RepID=A0A5Q4VEZ5_9BACT|nr:sigma-54 dependent transcriptional regulator [Desulfobotulus mexicanus]TYT76244.1 sigma-54-dependent Fis family transcriptional regulator [Desulfobotulus mexicanus]
MTSSRQAVIFASDSGVRDSLNRMLENCSCSVRPGRTETEALQLMQSQAPSLVVGVWEDGKNPLPFVAQAVSSRIPVLVLSGSVDVELAVDCIRAGALDFMLLPLEEDRLQKIFTGIFGEKAMPVSGRSLVTQDPGMQRLVDLTLRVAASRAPVFIQGESGTGKELFARMVHDNSPRRQGAFVAINCAALPENLLESELFGHEKGAFTGATFRKEGKFELAHGGTLLLDEVTEMPVHLQAKLLRVLQEGAVDRVGGLRPVHVDVRIVATTNRDLREAMEEGIFREDLYHRLNTIPLRIPPLRERPGDIPLLARHFIEKYNAEDGRSVKGLTDEALNCLTSVTFTGNVRELENVIRRAVLLCDGTDIKIADLLLEEDLPHSLSPGLAEGSWSLPEAFLDAPLKEVEKQMIFHTLKRFDGNRTHAAQLLGISVRTLRNKLNEYKNDPDMTAAV